MLAQGTPLHVVSEVLGHASIAITKDVYGHLLEGDKRAAAESMTRPCSAADCARGSQSNKKARYLTGNGPLTWARSEGLEPPTF
jgi:hypothetical protein